MGWRARRGHKNAGAVDRMCSRKRRYRYESDARRAAGAISAHGGPVMRVYDCPVCRGFHLTSKPPADRPVVVPIKIP